MQGRLLKMLVQMVRPKNIVEVGTFSGYSALCMGEGLASLGGNGHLWTFEANDELEPFTRKWIEESPWADRITLIIGDAGTEAPRVAKEQGLTYDLAFIDGDKRTYIETYEALLPCMSQGGIMLADNTLWDGHVTDPEYSHDAQTQGIRRFNDYIAADKRASRVLLPLRDGLTIIRINKLTS